MKKSTQICIIAIIILLLSLSLNAQNQPNLWTPIATNSISKEKNQFRKNTPNQFKLFKLNLNSFKSIIESAPSRNSQINSSTIIKLPTENGVLERFEIQEAPVLEDDLQNRFPNIRSFVGQGIDDTSAIARFSFSHLGVHVMISSVNYKTIYIDPYTKDLENYICYSRKDLPKNPDNFECLVKNEANKTIDENNFLESKNANDGKLRTFRLALACTGEYSQFHLNNQSIPNSASDTEKKAAVLAAMNTSITRVNGVYERDIAVTMIIINNNTDLIFLDGNTDPYTNNDGFAMLGENQTNIDNVIGASNYDIGHVYSTDGGGVAALNSPCTNFKAEGVTGQGAPIGDPFDIDYVAHEIGHQFGGNHTQNNNCQRSNASVEPGSASTIMGYAGICGPNVQNNSDAYFHAINIAEMWNNITNGNSTCGTQTDTSNLAPTANAGSNFTIPASTPFILRGNGSDTDSGNTLSYCWEQMDNQPAIMPPSALSTNGPAFRSLLPKASPDRYMPDISTVLAGQTQSTWEVVPSVSRTMNFILTVRDNVAGAGATASDNTIITVDGNSGPFVVTSQNTFTTWNVGASRTITWDVANTNTGPVNSPNVDILLSTDGGVTFAETLALAVSNSGNATITVPNVNTTEARIMVAGANHLFYNINTINFTISGTLSSGNLEFENLELWPNPTRDLLNVSFQPEVIGKVDIELHDLRGKLIHIWNFDSASNQFNKTLNISTISNGSYFVTIKNGSRKVSKQIIKK